MLKSAICLLIVDVSAYPGSHTSRPVACIQSSFVVWFAPDQQQASVAVKTVKNGCCDNGAVFPLIRSFAHDARLNINPNWY